MRPLRKYRIRISNGRASLWKTVSGMNEKNAKACALSPEAYRYGWEVVECLPAPEKELEHVSA